jgi:integrase
MFDGKPERIAQKWIDKSPGPYVFPVQSDTLIGSNLRTIAAVCKVDKRVTFHTARHTCATMLAEVTQNPFLMLNIMGWTDVRIAMNYIHRSFESTARQLKVYKDNWI